MQYFQGAGFAEYIGFKDYPTFLFIRDSCETMPNGFNDRDMIPLFTRRGKESLSKERYMHLVESFAPNFYQGLCDADTNVNSTKKRIQKSVDRTENFMDYCYERHSSNEKLKCSTLFGKHDDYNIYYYLENLISNIAYL